MVSLGVWLKMSVVMGGSVFIGWGIMKTLSPDPEYIKKVRLEHLRMRRNPSFPNNNNCSDSAGERQRRGGRDREKKPPYIPETRGDLKE